MVFSRADPVVLDLGPRNPPKKSDYEKKAYILRHEVWIRKLIIEAAENEGLSANTWCVRVLTEYAKRSNLYGWRTISPTDHPERVETAPPAPEPPMLTIQGSGVTWTQIHPDPFPTETVAGSPLDEPPPAPVFMPPRRQRAAPVSIGDTFSVTSDPSDATFSIPDGDIPELQ